MPNLHDTKTVKRVSRAILGATTVAGMACSAAASTLVPLATTTSFNYGVISYTDIADTFSGSPNAQLGLPAINNAGQIAFSAMTRSNIQHVYITPTSGSTLINVADSAHGFTNVGGRLDLNNGGTVVFQGTSATGANASQPGIFTSSGGAISLVVDSTTSAQPYFNGGAPRISDGGSTVFLGRGVGYPGQQIVVQKNGMYTAVASHNSGLFENFRDAALNNSGQVGFITDDYSTGNNNGAFAYRVNPGAAPVKISRVVTATSVGINDAGVMTFEAAAALGNGFASTGLVTSDGVKTTFIAQAGRFMPGTNILVDGFGISKSINRTGMVAMLAGDNAGLNTGIYVGDGVNTQTIVRREQSMFGKTVLDFNLSNDALNDSGQVTFNVRFTDNTYAEVRTSAVSMVPEPGTAFMMSLGGLAFVAMRRRRSVA